jgi:predicted MFS family arabinose efflux permease
LLAATTLREPARGLSEGLEAEGDVPSALEVIAFLWRARSFRHMSVATGLFAFAGYSTVTWAPTFLIRSHQMSIVDIGFWLAMIFGIAGGLGVFLGGVLADRWAGSDPRGSMYVQVVAMAAAFPFGFFVYTVDSATLCLVLLAVPSFAGLMCQAPSFAVTQSLATPKMRATAAALLLFVTNIIGLALGPLLTGILSDALEPRFGSDSLAWALLIVSMVYAWAGLHFWRASVHVKGDLEFARLASERESLSARER